MPPACSFFAYNAVQVVVAFAFFLDVCVDVGIRCVLRPDVIAAVAAPTQQLCVLEHRLAKAQSP